MEKYAELTIKEIVAMAIREGRLAAHRQECDHDDLCRKVGVVKDLAFRWKWLAGRSKCEMCGASRTVALRRWGWLGWSFVPHHIIGGPGRSDEACNLLAVCWQCHQDLHVGRLTREDAIEAKAMAGVKEWNPERLCELAGRKSLDMELFNES